MLIPRGIDPKAFKLRRPHRIKNGNPRRLNKSDSDRMVIAACLAGGFSCRVTLWDTVTITLSRVLKAVLPLEIFANMDRKNQAAVELRLASAERRGDLTPVEVKPVPNRQHC